MWPPKIKEGRVEKEAVAENTSDHPFLIVALIWVKVPTCSA